MSANNPTKAQKDTLEIFFTAMNEFAESLKKEIRPEEADFMKDFQQQLVCLKEKSSSVNDKGLDRLLEMINSAKLKTEQLGGKLTYPQLFGAFKSGLIAPRALAQQLYDEFKYYNAQLKLSRYQNVVVAKPGVDQDNKSSLSSPRDSVISKANNAGISSTRSSISRSSITPNPNRLSISDKSDSSPEVSENTSVKPKSR